MIMSTLTNFKILDESYTAFYRDYVVIRHDSNTREKVKSSVVYGGHRDVWSETEVSEDLFVHEIEDPSKEKHFSFSYAIPKSRPGHVMRFYAVGPEGNSGKIYKIVNSNTGEWFQWNVDSFTDMIIDKTDTPLPKKTSIIELLFAYVLVFFLISVGISAILKEFTSIRDSDILDKTLIITSVIALIWFIFWGRQIFRRMLKRKQAKKGIQKLDGAIKNS